MTLAIATPSVCGMHVVQKLPSPPPLSDLLGQHLVALFLDFDGTLVDIAEKPDAIAVPADLGDRLTKLGARLGGRLALISGRARGDLGAHLGATPIMIVGSHGAEFGDGDNLPANRSQPLDPAVASLAAQWPGLVVETKPHGLAIHYRQQPEAEAEAIAVLSGVARRLGLAVQMGKMVVEIGPANANKGDAVTRLMEQPPYVGAFPVFIGDDMTDEAGFAAAAAAGGFGILVGAPRPTAATFGVTGTNEVYAWLSL